MQGLEADFGCVLCRSVHVVMYDTAREDVSIEQGGLEGVAASDEEKIARHPHGEACRISVYLGETARSVRARALHRLGYADKDAGGESGLIWIPHGGGQPFELRDDVRLFPSLLLLFIFCSFSLCGCWCCCLCLRLPLCLLFCVCDFWCVLCTFFMCAHSLLRERVWEGQPFGFQEYLRSLSSHILLPFSFLFVWVYFCVCV